VSDPATFTVNIVAPPVTHTLTYTAGTGGSIEGSSTQVVVDGSDGTTVTAVPADGYRFVSWSDEGTSAERRDTAVTASLTVEASFVLTAVARDDTATAYSRPVYITPLANDDPGVGGVGSFTQPDDGTVTRAVVDAKAAGQVSVAGRIEGYDTLIYTPDGGFLGVDDFTYTTSSGQTATVTVSVVPGLSAPTGVEVAKVTTRSVEVTWTAPAHFGSGFAFYQLAWRSEGTVDWNFLDTIGDSATTHQAVTGLVPGVTYEFKVLVADTGDYVATSGLASFFLVGDAPGGVIPPVTVHGGSTATFTVDGVSEDASLSVDPGSDEIPGVGSIVVHGLSLSVVPEPGFSGLITLPVTVTHDGASSTVTAYITVNPGDPYDVTFGAVSRTRTRVQWAGSLNATGYLIYAGGSVVGTVGPGVSSFTIPRLLGPNSGVAVQAMGDDGTRSAIVRGTYRPGVAVKIGTITFGPNSAKLTASAKRTLKKLAALVKAQGFKTLTVNGVTGRNVHGSAAFRKRLATARGKAVRAYLVAEFKRLHVSVKVTIVTKTGSAIASKYRVAEIVLK